MAQKIQILFIDDLDGSAAEGTVRFGLDGTEYEIDLNARHARELRDALTRYVNAARRVGSSARKPARGSRGPVGGLNTTEIVYRRELRPVITTGAEIMDELFGAS